MKKQFKIILNKITTKAVSSQKAASVSRAAEFKENFAQDGRHRRVEGVRQRDVQHAALVPNELRAVLLHPRHGQQRLGCAAHRADAGRLGGAACRVTATLSFCRAMERAAAGSPCARLDRTATAISRLTWLLLSATRRVSAAHSGRRAAWRAAGPRCCPGCSACRDTPGRVSEG